MAVRTITTRLAVEGYSEFESAIAQSNRALKTLKSELDVARSSYIDNQNSLEALTAKEEAAGKVKDEYAKQVELTKDALEKCKAAQQTYSDAVDKHRAALADAEAVQKAYKDGSADTYDVIKLLTSEENDLTAEYDKAGAALSEAKKQLDDYKASGQTTETVVSDLEKNIRRKEDALESSKTALEKCSGALAAYKDGEKSTADTEKILETAVNDRSTALKNAQSLEESAARGTENTQLKLNNMTVQLNTATHEQERYANGMEEAKNSTDGCATSIDKYDKNVGEASASTGDMRDAISSMASVMASAGVTRLISELAGELKNCADASIEFESAFAGVIKTVDGSDAQLESISQGIVDMSKNMPATTTEISAVAEAAGQLGIKVEDITDFTEVMINLGEATNLSADSAASSLAKFANITQMSSDDYTRLGSVIVALGNNFATTESDIVSMATRLASSGNLVGLSESQIMAVSTALSSVGIEAEAGGSAVSKLFKTIDVAVATGSESIEDYASVAGVSAEEFSAAWGEDAVSALSMFISGLNDTERNGKSAIEILDGMGLTEVRLSNAILSLASSDDILTKSTELANKAWEENTALTDEAAARYATTESQISVFNNKVNDLKVSVGDVFNPALREAVGLGGDAVDVLTEFVKEHPEAVSAISAITAGIGVGAGGITLAAAVTKLLPLLSGLGTLITGPVGITVGILAAVSAIGVLIATMPEAESQITDVTDAIRDQSDAINSNIDAVSSSKDAYKELQKSNETQSDNIDGLIDQLIELTSEENDSVSAKAKLKSVVDELNAALPELNLNYQEIATGAKLSADAIREMADAQAKQTEYNAQIERYTELYKQLPELEANAATAKNNTAAAQRQYNAAYEAYLVVFDKVSRGDTTYEKALQTMSANVRDAKDALDSATTAQIASNAALSAAKIEYDSLGGAIDSYADKADAAVDSSDGLTSSQEELSTATGKTAEEISESTESLVKSAEELEEAWNDAYNSARSSVDGMFGLFDEVADRTYTATDDMKTSLGEQTDYINLYTDQLKWAAKVGFSDGFVATLADGSKESAEYLNSIATDYNNVLAQFGEGSPEAHAFVDDFNAAFEKSETAKTNFAATVAGMKTDFDTQSALIKAQAEDLAQDIADYDTQYDLNGQLLGSSVMEGIQKGLSENKYLALDEISGISQEMIDKFKELLEINSPSKVFERFGQYLVQGLAVGIDGNAETVYLSMEDMSQRILETIDTTVSDVQAKYAELIGKGYDYMTAGTAAVAISGDSSWYNATTLANLQKQLDSGNYSSDLHKADLTQMIASIKNVLAYQESDEYKTILKEADFEPIQASLSEFQDSFMQALVDAGVYTQDYVDSLQDHEAYRIMEDAYKAQWDEAVNSAEAIAARYEEAIERATAQANGSGKITRDSYIDGDGNLVYLDTYSKDSGSAASKAWLESSPELSDFYKQISGNIGAFFYDNNDLFITPDVEAAIDYVKSGLSGDLSALADSISKSINTGFMGTRIGVDALSEAVDSLLEIQAAQLEAAEATYNAAYAALTPEQQAAEASNPAYASYVSVTQNITVSDNDSAYAVAQDAVSGIRKLTRFT